MPLVLFRLRLGRLLGPRLRLSHRGRVSGRVYHTVLEVVGRDGHDVFVAAVWGPESDWYKNLTRGGLEAVTMGRAACQEPAHRLLDEDEGQLLLERYRARRPVWSRIVEAAIGVPLRSATAPVVCLTLAPSKSPRTAKRSPG